MKFSPALLTALLAGTALAHPSPLPEQDMTGIIVDVDGVVSIDDATFFDFDNASCSVTGCVSVIRAGVCIAAAISRRNVGALLKCAAKAKICSCAGCISALGNFLDSHHIC
jgi:hypothetical protein